MTLVILKEIKFFGNMRQSWQVDAETMENVTFGEQATSPANRRSTNTGSDGYRLLRYFIDTFARMYGFSVVLQ